MLRMSRRMALMLFALILVNGALATVRLRAQTTPPFQRCRYINHDGHLLEGCEDWIFTSCGTGACAPA